MTTLDDKLVGDMLNIEIEWGTQAIVDTVRDSFEESLGQLKPLLEAIVAQQRLSIEDLLRLPSLQGPGSVVKLTDCSGQGLRDEAAPPQAITRPCRCLARHRRPAVRRDFDMLSLSLR